MTQIRKIRFLYTLSLSLFIDIVWSFIIRLLFGKEYDYKLLIILIITAFGVNYIRDKFNNKYVSIVIPTVISLFFNLNSIYNVVVVAFIAFLLQEERRSNYNFSNIETSVKNCLAFLFLLGLVDMGRNIRLFVIFLVVSLLLQRESRSYSYKMKNSAYGNLIVAVFSILFSIDRVFLFFVSILKAIFQVLWIPISYGLIAFSAFLSFIFKLIFIAIGDVFTKEPTGDLKKFFENNSLKDNVEQMNQAVSFPPVIKIAIELAVVGLFIFFIYNIFKGEKIVNKEGESFVEIETEKIKEANTGKRRKYNYGKDIKDKILYMFLNFEGLANSKGLYKSSMTAEELGQKTKAAISKTNEIDTFINTYNEVKFSKQAPNEKQYEDLKLIFKALKKEMK